MSRRTSHPLLALLAILAHVAFLAILAILAIRAHVAFLVHVAFLAHRFIWRFWRLTRRSVEADAVVVGPNQRTLLKLLRSGILVVADSARPGRGECAMAPQMTYPHIETPDSQTAHVSSSSQRLSHPAYQALTALGDAAVPFLLADLEQTRDGHLSKALTEITGARPVPPEHRGQIGQIADEWLS
jgi:hypothetical protein